MRLGHSLSCAVVFATTLCWAEERAGEGTESLRAVLARAGEKLGAELRPIGDSTSAFSGSATRGLKTCDRIDLEVHLRDGGVVELFAYPRVGGERLVPSRATDRPALLNRLAAPGERIAPLGWDREPEDAVRASCTIRWADAEAAAKLEGALLATAALDDDVAALVPCFPPRLTEEEIAARLRDAAASDAHRGEILAGIAPYLPEVAPSTTVGRSTFQKIVLNGRGAGLDAFRFWVPSGAGERRLVWAFAYPPGTAKGWYIAPVAGDPPKFVKFHRGKTYEGSGIPEEHATLLQRTETALRPGAEYILWFQFKVEQPVEIYVALGCLPFVRSDRDAPAALEAALGLKESR